MFFRSWRGGRSQAEERRAADPRQHHPERPERDTTLRHIAEALEVSVPTVSEIELDRRIPSENLLRKIALLLDLDADVLRASPASSPTRKCDTSEKNPTALDFSSR